MFKTYQKGYRMVCRQIGYNIAGDPQMDVKALIGKDSRPISQRAYPEVNAVNYFRPQNVTKLDSYRQFPDLDCYDYTQNIRTSAALLNSMSIRNIHRYSSWNHWKADYFILVPGVTRPLVSSHRRLKCIERVQAVGYVETTAPCKNRRLASIRESVRKQNAT